MSSGGLIRPAVEGCGHLSHWVLRYRILDNPTCEEERMAVHTASPPDGCPDTSPIGVMKRTIVPNTVVCKATVGHFRDCYKEDIVLCYENSVQLLHLSNGVLQDVLRQDLHARAKTIDTLTLKNHNGCSKVRIASYWARCKVWTKSVNGCRPVEIFLWHTLTFRAKGTCLKFLKYEI